MSIFHRLKHALFPSRLRREMKELYSSVAILDFALSSVLIFEPIYLWQQGFSLADIMLFFVGVYVLYILVLPIGASYARRHGFEHSILLASPFIILYYVCFFIIPSAPAAIYGAVVALALYKAFYWPAYHADFAFYSQQEERGREIGSLIVLDNLVYILGPIVGGLLLTWLGFPALFIFVIIVVLASNIPLLSTSEPAGGKPFRMHEALSTLWAKGHRRAHLSYVGFGEELIVLTAWPLFLFLVIGNYASTGLIIAGSTLLSSLTVLIIGHLTDRRESTVVMRAGTILYAMVWLFRIVVRSAPFALVADASSRISKQMIAIPIVSTMYRRALRESVVATVVAFEIALSVGKILAALLVIVLTVLFPPGWTAAFILAAAFTLFFALDRHD